MAQKVPGISGTYASPVAAGGYVFLTGRSGTTVVLEDSPEFKIVATNEVEETVDATPRLPIKTCFCEVKSISSAFHLLTEDREKSQFYSPRAMDSIQRPSRMLALPLSRLEGEPKRFRDRMR